MIEHKNISRLRKKCAKKQLFLLLKGKMAINSCDQVVKYQGGSRYFVFEQAKEGGAIKRR